MEICQNRAGTMRLGRTECNGAGCDMPRRHGAVRRVARYAAATRLSIFRLVPGQIFIFSTAVCFGQPDRTPVVR